MKFIRLVATGVGIVLLAAVLLLAAEGFASIALAVRDLSMVLAPEPAERKHTQYDPDLGWSNIPNFEVKDMYGPGIDLKINAQGFRQNEDITPAIPDGKFRIICSGDSFTLGYGVSNLDTWCAQMERMDPTLQTVNMGQGGYGLDQIYLWFMRDGVKLDYDVHVLALIANDLSRLQFKRQSGYEKPYLRIERGELAVKNVPVPKTAERLRWYAALSHMVRQLRLMELIHAAGAGGSLDGQTAVTEIAEEEGVEVVFKVFERLAEVNRAKNKLFVVLYIPTLRDSSTHELDEIRAFLKEALAHLNIMFVDLTDSFQELPPAKRRAMYIRRNELPDYPGSAGHLTVEGNHLVAQLFLAQLQQNLQDAAENVEWEKEEEVNLTPGSA